MSPAKKSVRGTGPGKPAQRAWPKRFHLRKQHTAALASGVVQEKNNAARFSLSAMRVWTPKKYEEDKYREVTRKNFSNSTTSLTASTTRPSTAGSIAVGVKLGMSSSLPKLTPIEKHQGSAQVSVAQSVYEQPVIELRKRNRELEQTVKRLNTQLAYLDKSENKKETRQRDVEQALRAEYERRLLLAEQDRGQALQEAEARKEYALEKLRKELTGQLNGTMAEEAKARDAKHREERIDLVVRQSARRMRNRRIAKGFMGWLEMWEAKTRAMAKLRQVGGRLRSPELSMAFGFWASDYQEAAQARLAAAAAAAASGLSAEAFKAQQLKDQLKERNAELERSRAERTALEERIAFLEDTNAGKLKVAKEERIALLRRQSMRRMLNAALADGWSAWFSMWEARVYAKNRLREVANRLRAPELSAAFGFWFADMNEDKQAALADQSAALKRVRSSLENQIELQRSDYERRLADLQEQMRVALERQQIELVGTAEQQAAVREAREKEERIELLRRQVARRMMNAGITRGWTAWCEMWQARTQARQRLRDVANRLRAPELSIAFGFWAGDMIEARAEKQSSEYMIRQEALETERKELLAELQRVRAKTNKKIGELTKDRIALMEKLAQLTSGSAESEALLEAKEAAAKEERIEQLRVRVGRRMLNQGISNGFQAWLDFWEAKTYAYSRLRQVASHLRSPELSTAFGHWLTDLEEERIVQAQKALHAKRDAASREEIERLQREADELRAKYEAVVEERRVDAENAKLELERQKVVLIGSAAEQAVLRAETEKEGRIEMLKRQAVRRMLMQDLSAGWDAWVATYYAMRRLRQIAARLKAPVLSQTFEFWVDDCKQAKQEAKVSKLKAKSMDRDAAVRRAEHELSQIKMLNTALEDENGYLKMKLSKVTELSVQQADELATARPLLESQAAEIERLKTALAEQQELTAEAVKKRTEIEAETAKQLKLAQQTLERLLAEQRETFENDSAALRTRVTSSEKACKKLEKELSEAKAHAAKLQAKLDQIAAKEKEKADAAAAKAAAARAAPTVAGRPFEFDPEKPVSDQLAQALRNGSARVLDLFRQWDTDGDGEVSRQEFLVAMPKLGFDVPKEGILKLFDEWDTDGGGTLSFGELKKILSKRSDRSPGAAGAPGAAPPKAKLGAALKVAKMSAAASKASASN